MRIRDIWCAALGAVVLLLTGCSGNGAGPSGGFRLLQFVESGKNGIPRNRDLVFRFSSDGAWSDEDGLLITDIGAVWLDNLQLTVDGGLVIQTDFELGTVPAEVTFTSPPGTGDFAALYANLYTEDICASNPIRWT